jgi:hypothetical protein
MILPNGADTLFPPLVQRALDREMLTTVMPKIGSVNRHSGRHLLFLKVL